MIITSTIKYALVVVALLVGIGIKVYLGNTTTENMIEEGIETVVKDEAGVDLTPILSPVTPVA
jgi:hypothetical protein